MTATLRFGTPSPDAAEQVTLQTRWGDPAVPKQGEWRDTFVYAIGVTATALNVTWRNLSGGGTESFELNSTARHLAALHHPDSGILRNGFNAIAYWNASSSATGWATDIEASGRPLRIIQGITGDVDTEWLNLSDAAAAAANIDTVLTTPLGRYDAHPAVIAYCLADDLTNDAVHGRRSEELMDRIPELDAAGRPATPSFLGNNASNEVDLDIWDIGLFGGGGYPVRWLSTGVKRTEGDFTHATDSGNDWYEWIKIAVLARPDAHIYWWLQAHQLGDGSITSLHLSYPTAREIRKQVWEAVMAGAKGLLWFVYQDEPAGPWVGLAHPSSADRMAAVAEMGARLKPNIRTRLLRCTPIDETVAGAAFFTASGGGATYQYATYANASIGTLYDARAGVYYCVVCNRAATTSDVTIDSTSLLGTLVNLEDGSELAVGESVSLPALDGTIFRLRDSVSLYGIPNITLTEAYAGTDVEDWWADHWANPASPNYIAPGDVPTHPNIVYVSNGDNLQDAIDAAPDNTTFVLSAGATFEQIRLYQRSGMHFVSSNPAGTDPIIRGVYLRSWIADHYRGCATCPGWVSAILGTGSSRNGMMPGSIPEARAAFLNPCRDFLFRNIHIEGPSDELVHIVTYVCCGVSDTESAGYPFHMMGVKDVLVEQCTIDGWRYSPNNVWPLVDTSNFHHGGIVQGTGGAEGIVFRDTVIRGHEADAPYGYPYGLYLDGGMNSVVYNCDFTGKYYNGNLLFLTNDDIINDWDGIL